MGWENLLAGINKPLKQEIEALRPEMVAAAQAVYDEWEQDGEGLDEERGEGGICDGISEAITGVIAFNVENIELDEGGQEGDDHAYTVAYNEDEAYAIDIHPSVYETGGGYSWKKVPDVKFEPTDIEIFETTHPDTA